MSVIQPFSWAKSWTEHRWTSGTVVQPSRVNRALVGWTRLRGIGCSSAEVNGGSAEVIAATIVKRSRPPDDRETIKRRAGASSAHFESLNRAHFRNICPK
jgi:hypothetical protein